MNHQPDVSVRRLKLVKSAKKLPFLSLAILAETISIPWQVSSAFKQAMMPGSRSSRVSTAAGTNRLTISACVRIVVFGCARGLKPFCASVLVSLFMGINASIDLRASSNVANDVDSVCVLGGNEVHPVAHRVTTSMLPIFDLASVQHSVYRMIDHCQEAAFHSSFSAHKEDPLAWNALPN